MKKAELIAKARKPMVGLLRPRPKQKPKYNRRRFKDETTKVLRSEDD